MDPSVFSVTSVFKFRSVSAFICACHAVALSQSMGEGGVIRG